MHPDWKVNQLVFLNATLLYNKTTAGLFQNKWAQSLKNTLRRMKHCLLCIFQSHVYFTELQNQNVLIQVNSKSMKYIWLFVSPASVIPTVPDLLHCFKTAKAAGEHLLIKNTISKPLGSGFIFSLSTETCSVHSDRKFKINKLPFSKFCAAVYIGSHALLVFLCWFSALDT